MAGRRAFLKSLLALAVLPGLAGCSQLGAFNAVIPHDSGVARRAVGVAYGSDPRQTLDVYAPLGGPKGVVVFIYGGSWNSGGKEEYAFAAKALASHGYLTVVPDYRLVPGFRYPVFVQDTAKATAWAYRHAADYGGDPDRLFLVGHSAGAYNVMMVALAPEFLKAEGLSPAILRGAAGLSGPYDFLPLDVDETRQAFADVADLAATQPVNRVGAGGTRPAFFLASGEADTLVYPRNTRALAKALARAGRRVETHYYPGIDHPGTLLALSRPLRDRAPVLDQLIAFLDKGR